MRSWDSEVGTLARYQEASKQSSPEVDYLNHYVSLSLSQVIKSSLRTVTVQQSAGEVHGRSSCSVMQHLICLRLPEQLIKRLEVNGSLVKLALPSRQMASWEDPEQMPTMEGQSWHSIFTSGLWRIKVTCANPTGTESLGHRFHCKELEQRTRLSQGEWWYFHLVTNETKLFVLLSEFVFNFVCVHEI